MTGKIINKDSFALLFISILTLLAFLYGFSSIPNPTQQREIKLDQQRVSDLGKIKEKIADYYLEENVLPQTLTNLENTNYSYYEELNIVDPDTGTPYEYIVEEPTAYQLCATFSTDSSKETAYIYDTNNYSYLSYKEMFEHPVGRKCFGFTVTPNYQYQEPVTPVINTLLDLQEQASLSAQ